MAKRPAGAALRGKTETDGQKELPGKIKRSYFTMRIQHNIMAMNAYRNYNNNTTALSTNL